MSGYIAGHNVIYFCCSLLSFVSFCNGSSEKQERSDRQMYDRYTELRDVTFVIQSQRNSYHTLKAEQRRREILHQAQTLNQSSPDVVLLHKLSDYDGNWSLLPALTRLASQYCQTSSWIVFLDEETLVNLRKLLLVLSKFNTSQEWFLGRSLHDDEPSIIHHYAFSEDPYSFSYPDFMAGWALSCPLAKRTAERVNFQPPKSDFTIDLQHEIALYIWEEGRGPALTAVNEFCSELHSSSSTRDCATAINSYLYACGNPVRKENIFVAVKTCQKFHEDRVPIVKQTWERDAALLEYYSDITDPYIPTIHLGVPNTERELYLSDDGENNKFQRMPCLAHTLQLTLKDAIKHPNVNLLLTRARKLTHTVRKSSVANEAIMKKCGKSLVRDCCTRWNSTFDMLRRLLEIRTELNQVLEELGMDTLLTSNWAKMENLVKLLEPFSIHTDQLQSDRQSLSQVVPCLLNLEAHLLTTTFAGKQLAQVLLKSLRERFASILSPDSPQFDATSAAACLLDPSVSLILQTPDMVPLRRAAQSLVQNMAAQYYTATPSQHIIISNETAAHSPPTVFQKYRYLASRMAANVLVLTNENDGANSVMTEMNKYDSDVRQGVFNETPLQFWRSREAVYPNLAPVALDLVSAPASQAFVDVFSLCVDCCLLA